MNTFIAAEAAECIGCHAVMTPIMSLNALSVTLADNVQLSLQA
ncbi:Uncharacterised protein [Shigella flexneri]|nr:Uncharacterised protein [Shigella flexneri]